MRRAVGRAAAILCACAGVACGALVGVQSDDDAAKTPPPTASDGAVVEASGDDSGVGSDTGVPDAGGGEASGTCSGPRTVTCGFEDGGCGATLDVVGGSADVTFPTTGGISGAELSAKATGTTDHADIVWALGKASACDASLDFQFKENGLVTSDVAAFVFATHSVRVTVTDADIVFNCDSGETYAKPWTPGSAWNEVAFQVRADGVYVDGMKRCASAIAPGDSVRFSLGLLNVTVASTAVYSFDDVVLSY